MRRSHPAMFICQVSATTLAFFFAAKFGLSYGIHFGNITPIWPAAGIGIAAAFWFGVPGLIGVGLGSLASSTTTELPLMIYPLLAALNIAESHFGAKFVRSKSSRFLSPFYRASSTMRFIVFSAIAIPAVIGFFGAFFLGFLDPNDSAPKFFLRWVTWFVGDMLGAIVVAPLLIIVAPYIRNPARFWRNTNVRETLTYFAVFAATSTLVFFYSIVFSAPVKPSLLFMLVPLILWSSFRLGPAVSVISIASISVVAIYATINSFGPFVADSELSSLIGLQFYIATVSSSALILNSVIDERTRASRKQMRTSANLERLVKLRTDQALESRKQLDFAMQAAQVGSWAWDISSNRVDWDKSLYDMLDYKGDVDPTFENFLTRVHPEDLARIERASQDLPNKEGLVVDEFRIVTADEEIRHMESRAMAVRKDNGELSRLTGVCLDITENRITEQNLHETINIFHELSENMNEVFWMRDIETQRFLFVSSAYEKLWGRPVETLYENPDDWIASVHAADRDAVMNVSRQRLNDVTVHEYRVIADKERWVRERWFPIKDTNGNVYRTAGIISDITEVKDIEKLRIEKAAIRQADKAKTRFLANVSHEMRTPLTSIRGFIPLLRSQTVTPSETHCYLDIVDRSSGHLETLIDDLLDMSKIESGQLDISRTEISLPAEINAAVDCVKGNLAKGVKLSVKYYGAVPESFQTDGQRFRQILINLLGNAVKFTEQGSIKVVVSFERFIQDQPFLRVRVTDTGRGIPAKYRGEIFEPFMSLREGSKSNTKGSGLGLTLSKSIARCLGGDIRLIKSVDGEGSTFEFVLSIDPTSSLRLIRTSKHVDGLNREIVQEFKDTIKSLPIKHKTVLLAEDVPEIQMLVRSYLELAGARVVVCENGKKAVEAIDKTPEIDAILMDMQMPVMDGYEATTILRERGYNAPIIAVTAHAMYEDRQNCLRAGCNDYLRKPINPNIMVETIACLTS